MSTASTHEVSPCLKNSDDDCQEDKDMISIDQKENISVISDQQL